MYPLRIGTLALLSLSLMACVGHGEAEPWISEQQPDAPAAAGPPRTLAPTIPTGRLLGAYHNVEMSVTHPGNSAEAARTIVVEAGGEVLGFNTDTAQASLSVGLDPEIAERVLHALKRLPGVVVRENSNTNDLSQSVRQLADRLGKLEYSEAEMDQIMRASNHSETFDAWMVQRELSARERENLHNQLQSYLQQVRRTQISMTFTSGTAPANVGHKGFREG